MVDESGESRRDTVETEGGKRFGKRGKVGLLTVVLLLVEAAAIGGGFMVFSSPRQTEAESMTAAFDTSEHEVMLEEVVIFEGNLGNDSSGVALRYPTRIYFKVDARDRHWIEAEASRSSGTIHARLSEIWKLAARRELESPDLAVIEARINKSFAQDQLFTRRPTAVNAVFGETGTDGFEAAAGRDSRGIEGLSSSQAVEGPIVRDVIVVLDIGRRVHR